jgi:hypothetical protein
MLLLRAMKSVNGSEAAKEKLDPGFKSGVTE